MNIQKLQRSVTFIAPNTFITPNSQKHIIAPKEHNVYNKPTKKAIPKNWNSLSLIQLLIKYKQKAQIEKTFVLLR